jgi:D-alanyl-D-alanine carboxypeptidase
MRILALTLALTTPIAAESLAQKPAVADQIRLIESWCRGQLDERRWPGMTVAVVHGEDTVWKKAFGYADVASKKPMTTDTLFRMASNSKMFTALALLQLRDAGKLSLDDPVKKHLPWFALKTAPDGVPITIRHLITHTSGLPRESASPYWNTLDFPTREQLRERVKDQEAAFAPETRWKYSNLALSVAGEVVEAVSGEPYALYIEKHLLKPMGMTASTMTPGDAEHARLATGYFRLLPGDKREAAPFADSRGITAAAGLSSNAEDMARFMIAMMRRGKSAESGVLKGTTLAEMQRVHWLEPNWTSAWGLGFSVTKIGDRTVAGHGGSYPGYRTQTSFAPADKVGVVVLINASDANPTPVVRRLYADLVPAIVEAAAPTEKKPDPRPEWSDYTGRYVSRSGVSEVLLLDGVLTVISPTDDDPKATAQTLKPRPDGTFVIDAKSGGSSIGEKAEFVRDASGKVVKMRLGWFELDRER